MHEFEFIDWIRRRVGRPKGRRGVGVGIGDDLAVLRFGGRVLLIGSDMTIEGVHFTFKTATPRQVGHKALGRCLSDCAAMAGVPLGAIVSVAVPKGFSNRVLKDVYRGMIRLANRFDCPIIGGDTSTSRRGLVIDVCLLGACEGNAPVLRSGARPGDTLYVTGRLGGSILKKHLTFEPHIEAGRWLAQHLPLHAMIDLSDGLSSDLNHLCRESRCGAELFESQLARAVSPAAKTLARRTGKSPLVHALNDGEDFELLAAIGLGPEKFPPLPPHVQLLPIGRITRSGVVELVTTDGRRKRILPQGFRHF